ncbi:interleukin-26 [Antrostomus carolinensis]|uniref:interleukin-26 n=1 Tax=Antrostomus carolinensis TaxID=279965 RepID=UPI0010A991A5|nr:interleukin-26 [Antrostomus carolinensis]
MKLYSVFRSGHFLVLLCLFTVEGKKSATGKHTCRKGLLSQVTENLCIKATSLKSSVPKDLIKNTRLLKKTTKILFMLPCAPSTRLTSAVKKLKKTFLKLGEKGIYKAIHELDILLPWIQAYIQSIV